MTFKGKAVFPAPAPWLGRIAFGTAVGARNLKGESRIRVCYIFKTTRENMCNCMPARYLLRMRKLIALFFLLIAMPAHAERLNFDHRLSPPLQRVLDEGRSEMVQFDGSDPTRLVDLIAVRGQSASSWNEALQIVSIPTQKKLGGAEGWMGQIQDGIRARASAACKAEFTVLARDEISVTFERKSPGCGPETVSYGLYRLVTGKRSWFQLAVLAKDGISDEAKAQWLALLASAHLE